jgi:hypothetical protein
MGLDELSGWESRLWELFSLCCCESLGLGFTEGVLWVAVVPGSGVRDSRTRETVVGLTVTVGSTVGFVVSLGSVVGDSEDDSGCSAVAHWAPDEHEVSGVGPVEADIIHPLATPTITIPPTTVRSIVLLRLLLRRRSS